MSEHTEVSFHDLLIETKTKSKAKILGTPVKSFLEGGEYCASFILTNLGKDPFPGGKLTVRVHWPTDQINYFEVDLPKILPNKSFPSEEMEGNVLSTGYGLFYGNIRSSDRKPVHLFKDPKTPILMEQFKESFHSIFGKTHEEIYEFWGMLIAAVALAIIAIEKIAQFFLWWLFS